MKVFDRAVSVLLLGPTAVLASDVLFTTVRINTGICAPTGGGNGTNDNENGGNSTRWDSLEAD